MSKSKKLILSLLLLAAPITTCGTAFNASAALADTCDGLPCSAEPPVTPTTEPTPWPAECDEHPEWCLGEGVSITPVLWLPQLSK